MRGKPSLNSRRPRRRLAAIASTRRRGHSLQQLRVLWTAASATRLAGVPRLVILWRRPEHLEPAEGDDWVRSQTVGLRVVGARAVEVQSAAFEHPVSWHWMLELEVDDAASAERSLRSGPVADWVHELRQLKMRPTVMLVADRPGLGPAA